MGRLAGAGVLLAERAEAGAAASEAAELERRRSRRIRPRRTRRRCSKGWHRPSSNPSRRRSPSCRRPSSSCPKNALDELLGVVLVVVVEVVGGVAGAAATVEVGTVSGGAPEVSAVVDEPPPQAASAPESASWSAQEGQLPGHRPTAPIPARAFRAQAAPFACRSAGSRSGPSARAGRTNCRTAGFRPPRAAPRA